MVPAHATNQHSQSWIKRPRTAATLVIIGVVALSACLTLHALGAVPCDRTFQVSVQVRGEAYLVDVEEFFPQKGHSGPLPAVMFLHGVEGPERYRSVHTRSCRWLANQGYAVFYVHYFDAVPYEDLWHLRTDGSLDKERIDRQCWADADGWSATVLQALSAIARRPNVDNQRIAVDGISLGGFIALEVADEASRRSDVVDVCAVVANWCGQFELTDCQPGFPPTLHIHGEHDDVVPLNDARNSVAEIQTVGSEAELLVIPQAPHVARSSDSDRQTLNFLAKHLRPGIRAASYGQAPLDAGQTELRLTQHTSRLFGRMFCDFTRPAIL